MPIEILMPALSPTMKEGNLAKWLKKEGDEITSGDVMAEIETDKATMEVEAVDEGVLGKILVKEGSKGVAVNEVIALLLEEGEDKKALDGYKISEKKTEAKKEEKQEAKPAPAPKAKENKQPAKNAAPQNVVPLAKTAGAASPVAKRIAAQNNIDISAVKGSGPQGRVVKSDIMGYLSNPTSSDVIVRDSEETTEIPNSNVRQVIADRLLESKQTVPHFYLSIDVNIESLLDLRAQVNSAAAQDERGRPAYKISVNDLVIKASALALKKVPEANSSWAGESIIRHNNVDISVAVAIDEGLITPIIRNADQKSVIALSAEMKELAAKARAGTLALEEFQGGSFSISNLGMFGIKQFNAIINPPQSCILSVGAGEKRAIIADDGSVKAADIVTISLSCDHRVVDGAVGAELLKYLKYHLEKPATLLL